MKDEALKQALEALQFIGNIWHMNCKKDEAITAIQEALAQPAQEPKSVTYKEVADTMNALRKGNFSQQAVAKEVGELKLYTSPPQRPWVGLTEDDLLHIGVATGLERAAMEMISNKLKEKNK
jgi:hypothetical protein